MINFILATFSERARNPWVGSIFLGFLAINWQTLMYLFYAEKDLSVRISYFNDHTTINTLVFIPVAVGFGLSVVMPWVTSVHYWACNWPRKNINDFHWELKVNNIKNKNNFEEEALVLTETTAKREKAANRIENPDTLAQLNEEITNVLKKNTGQDIKKPLPNLNAYFKDNSFKSKKLPELLKGTAQCLTNHQNTFSKLELFEYIKTHQDWFKGMNKNNKSTWRRLQNNSQISEKLTGQWEYIGDKDSLKVSLK